MTSTKVTNTRGTKERSKILVVDDEKAVCVALQAVLSREGYQVATALSGEEALQLMEQDPADLALLDLNMKGMDGLELMKIIRNRWPLTVVMILTGYGTLESALDALRHGAHDYLLKPSSPEDIKASIARGLAKRQREARRRDLLARIEADVRALHMETAEVPLEPAAPPPPKEERVIDVGRLVIDLDRHMAFFDGKPVSLTPMEFNVLVSLAKDKGRVKRCAEIVHEVHGYTCSEPEARAIIKTHISHLRRKIEPDPSRPRYILNVRGVGYMLVDPDEE